MTITWILYFLVLWSLIQANQPDGYLGCFADFRGNSLNNSQYIYYGNNKGELCKAGCKRHNKRYAGTKYSFCYCGSDVYQNRKRNSTECNRPCPGNSWNSNETCGSFNYTRISIYDTWQTTATTTTTIFPLSSALATESIITTQTVTSTTTTIFFSSRTRHIESSTAAPQPEGNQLAVYIAVPVSIVVIIVFILIVAVLILRKKLNQNKDSEMAVYQNSANTGHSVFTVVNNAYNDHDIFPLKTTVNVNATKDNEADQATEDSEHNYFTLEQTGDVNRSYNNAEQRRSSAIQIDENDGYGHLHARSTALFDPTYSHTTTTGSQGTTDYTYSHTNMSVGHKNHEIMSNNDKETYNACDMKRDTEKLRPAVEITDTDDTYNRLAISGKTTNIGQKHTVSSVNEPDYDHTDVRNH